MVHQLQPLLAPDDFITMLRLDLITKWFGEFFLPDGQGADIVEEMKELVVQPWFAGELAKEVADRWLFGREEATFLVRLSQTDAVHFPFTISKRKDSKNAHRRIQRLTYDMTRPDRFSVETFDEPISAMNIVELINKLRVIHSVGNECPREELASENP